MYQHTLDKWQYRISASPFENGRQLGRFWLETGPSLPHFAVHDSTGKPAGIILGQVIDLKHRIVVEDSWTAPAALEGNVDHFAKQVLWSLGGNFLWIFVTDGVSRIYPDCSAQLPCVWDAAAGMAGSTAHALFDDAAYAERMDVKLHDMLGVDGEGWFPAGQTAHVGLERLLPCHYLDLEDWSARRFWSAADVERASMPRDSIRTLAEHVRAQMEAIIATSKRLGLGLTAGRETRTLLACAQSLTDKIDAFTVVGTDRHMIDSIVARRIAREFKFRHRELQRTSATKKQRDRFVRRGGHCYGDSNSWFHPSGWPIAESHVMVGGTGGEVARSFFWRASDREETEITPQLLVSRLGLPQAPSLVGSVAKWLKGLPPMNAFQILDQAYLELRMGSWHGVQFCCNPTVTRISPLLTFPCVEILLALPDEWKRQSRFVDEVIQTNWPELLRIPFNSLGWLRDGLITAQKVAANPAVVWKRLRKMRG
jgi:hypothetical protein